jgi:hypothetical protein
MTAVVFTTFSPAEAHLIRSRLEAAGCHAFVQHELSSSLEGYALALGGIRVEVPESEASIARELIGTGTGGTE